MKTTTKKELSFGKGSVIIPCGTIVEVVPIYEKIKILGYERPLTISPTKLHECFKRFKKPPTLKTLFINASNGITTTPRGKKVELDGMDEEGFKSWFSYLVEYGH